jgi:hypothetical protein
MMAWWLWTIAAIPALGVYLVVARMLAGHVAHREAAKYPSHRGVPDKQDWANGWWGGAFWPFVLSYLLILAAIVRLWRLAPPIGAERKHLAEHRRLELLEAVDQTERNLGIKT